MFGGKKHSYISLKFTLAQDDGAEPVWEYKLAFKHVGGGIRKNEVAVIYEEVTKVGENILTRKEQDENEG